MYNRQLDAFIKAAELGSFSKAANELNITPTSLIQQINLLEFDLSLHLFIRSHRGVKLTQAGLSIYEDAKNIVELSKEAIDRAKRIEDRSKHTIRIATSLFTKCRFLTEIASKSLQSNSDLKIELVSQKSIREMTENPLSDLAKSYDIQEGIYIDGLYRGKCCFLKLLDARLSVAISEKNKLREKKKINIHDLEGETIVIAKKGQTKAFDELRDMIEKENIALKIIEKDYYDIDTFSLCEINNYILVSLDIFSDIYPSMMTIPIDKDLYVPYGIMYSKDANDDVLKLLEIAKSLKIKNG